MGPMQAPFTGGANFSRPDGPALAVAVVFVAALAVIFGLSFAFSGSVQF